MPASPPGMWCRSITIRLLGKVICAWGADPRAGSPPRAMAQALEATRCAGVQSNEQFLAAIVREPAFLAVRRSVAYLAGAACGARHARAAAGRER